MGCSDIKAEKSKCNGFGKIKSVYGIKDSYNYPAKIFKAIEDGNQKYINKMISKGIIFKFK